MKSIDTIRLRKFVGWLGFSLAWIVLGLCILFNCVPGNHIFPNSISATYYYAPTITPFMIILGASSILLMCYCGYTWVDDLINTITGMFGLGICLFPTYSSKYALVGTFQIPVDASYVLHNICAIGFFALLSFNVLFLFTKSSGEMTRNKKIRNIIYRVCGVGMLSAMACLAIFRGTWAITWWVEAIALAFFGIAFLTKADVYPWLFCDSKNEDKETDNA
jgi:hypothetical protein